MEISQNFVAFSEYRNFKSWNLLDYFFFHLITSLLHYIFCYWHFFGNFNLLIIYYIKWCPIFDDTAQGHNYKHQKNIQHTWFLRQNLTMQQMCRLKRHSRNFVRDSWPCDSFIDLFVTSKKRWKNETTNLKGCKTCFKASKMKTQGLKCF